MGTGMETSFSPLAALSGGALIGLSALLLMWRHGRVLGLTGIFDGAVFSSDRADRIWRLALLAGILIAPSFYMAFSGTMPAVEPTVSLEWLGLGGFLVGVGVALARGCTSGHGVCGLARLSRRSIAATLTFMASTAVTVYLLRHGPGG